MQFLNDDEYIRRLAADDKAAFNSIVETYYTSLSRSALKFVRHPEPVEEIVQDVLVSLWQKRHTLVISVSLQAYLHTAVRYQCLNYLRNKFSRPAIHMEIIEEMHPVSATTDEQLDAHELKTIIAKGIQKLPDRCRIIFDLSRNADLSYREIATQLGISQKTVETQMSIALSRLKAYLHDHWDKLIVLPLLFSLV